MNKLKQIKISIICVLVFSVFIALNLLISPLSFRFDFSYGKAYTLSSSTKKIIKKLNNIVTIEFFASSDLPTKLLPVKNEITALLNEYKKENSGKLTIKVLDPKKDQNALQEAKDLGIPELQFSQLEQDKYALTNAYFGIALSYGDKKEIIPQAIDLESLEYNLTSLIYKMTTKKLAKIAVIGQEDSQLATFKKIVQQQFELNFIKEIDSSYKTLFIFDTTKKEYNSQEIETIKKYLDNGGKAIFFVDGVWVDDSLAAGPAKHNLFSLLNNYGIKEDSNLVLSTNAELVNFRNSMVSFMIPYPFWVKTNNFAQKTSYFSNINQLTFPWVSPLEIEKKTDIETQILIKTNKQSWTQANNYILDPQNIPQPKQSDLKEFTIAAYAKEKNKGEIVVIPSSRFVLDRYLSRNSNNLELVLNVVNNFASGGALSGIRQRVVSFYPLPDIPDSQKDIFKYANILVLPLLFGFFGALRLIKRR